MKPEEAVEIIRENLHLNSLNDPGKEGILAMTHEAIRYLKPPAKILDFGAGTCERTVMFSLLGFNCSACDDFGDPFYDVPGAREKILAFAQKFNINYLVIDGKQDLPFKKSEFDILMMIDVLEHLHDPPRELMNTLLDFVKPEGYFICKVPNAVNLWKRVRVAFGKTNFPRFESYYWQPGPWRGHIREYVRNDLEQLAKYLNLDILELRGINLMTYNLPPPLRLLWNALTRIINSGSDSWILVARKKRDWKTNKCLSNDEMLALKLPREWLDIPNPFER